MMKSLSGIRVMIKSCYISYALKQQKLAISLVSSQLVNLLAKKQLDIQTKSQETKMTSSYLFGSISTCWSCWPACSSRRSSQTSSRPPAMSGKWSPEDRWIPRPGCEPRPSGCEDRRRPRCRLATLSEWIGRGWSQPCDLPVEVKNQFIGLGCGIIDKKLASSSQGYGS